MVVCVTRHVRSWTLRHVFTVLLAIGVVFGIAVHGPSANAQTSVYQEAPQLKDLVAAGKLPPIDQRLPQNPMLIQPVEQIGQYGGTWYGAIKKRGDRLQLTRTIAYEYLVRWDPQWTAVVPNVAERFEVNDTATEFTFYLRKGLKWSDGVPFTADDILFWYEGVLMNTDLTGSVPQHLKNGGEPVVVIKMDDFTVRFSFVEPNGLFLMQMATTRGAGPTLYPRHYLQQYHLHYNPAQIEKLVAEAGVKTWVELFEQKAGTQEDSYAGSGNPDRPVLHAWVLKNAYPTTAQELVAERNPYYWKVDTAGNQLPYLDRVVFHVFEEEEQLETLLQQGKLNMQMRHLTPALVNKVQSQYQLIPTIPSHSNTAVVSLNQTCTDAAQRVVFQNKDFRIGLSLAVNRQEMISKHFHGEGEPYQAAPKRESPFYHERLAKQYLEYDITLANQYLDQAGYTQRDAEGFRLRPDGQRLGFTLETVDVVEWFPLGAIAQDLSTYWRHIGVDVKVSILDRKTQATRKNNNEHEATVWSGDGGIEVLLEPRYYFPYSSESHFATLWARWFSGGGGSQEPPAEVQHQIELYRQIGMTADPAKQQILMQQVLDIAADQFYVIGISTPPVVYALKQATFHNVPAFMPSAAIYPSPAPTNPCQYFVSSQ